MRIANAGNVHQAARAAGTIQIIVFLIATVLMAIAKLNMLLAKATVVIAGRKVVFAEGKMLFSSADILVALLLMPVANGNELIAKPSIFIAMVTLFIAIVHILIAERHAPVAGRYMMNRMLSMPFAGQYIIVAYMYAGLVAVFPAFAVDWMGFIANDLSITGKRVMYLPYVSAIIVPNHNC